MVYGDAPMQTDFAGRRNMFCLVAGLDRDRLHPRLDYFRPIFGLSDLVFYQSLWLTDTTVRGVHNTQVAYTHRWHQQIV